MNINNFVLLILLLSVISCQPRIAAKMKSTYNNGGYTVSILKKKSPQANNDIVIYGSVNDVGNKSPLIASVIKIGCNSISVNNTGVYYAKEKAVENLFITCTSIGHLTLETENLKLQKGDSVRVNFFLAQDERPLVNCEGQTSKR